MAFGSAKLWVFRPGLAKVASIVWDNRPDHAYIYVDGQKILPDN